MNFLLKTARQQAFMATIGAAAAAFSLDASACPRGLLFDGSTCSPPYAYSMNDWLRERHEYIDSLGPKGPPAPGLSVEEIRALRIAQAAQDKENLEKRLTHAKGVWNVQTKSSPDGKMCAAVFSKYQGEEGGMVTILGFQQPMPDAWLMFYGAHLPKPRKVEKLQVTLQQDDEPAQSVQVFNYRESREVGVVTFAVPGLAAAVDGMRDKQSFKLSVDGKVLLSIQWADAAPVIAELKQCAK